MARKKSTKRALEAIEYYQKQLAHMEEIIKIKSTPWEYQPSWYQEKSIEYFEGWIMGILCVVEDIIMKENSWKGFKCVNSKGEWLTVEDGKTIAENPEYRSYRVQHFGA